jgi:peptidyl-prolyl cis-trans isomerase SurA
VIVRPVFAFGDRAANTGLAIMHSAPGKSALGNIERRRMTALHGSPTISMVRAAAVAVVCVVAPLCALAERVSAQSAPAQATAAAPQSTGQAAKPTKPAPVKAASGKSAAAATGAPAGKGGQAIIALINDEPISAYDVDQRINLLLLTSGSINERLKAKLQDPGINEKFKQYALARNPNIRSQDEIKALQQQFVQSMRQQALAEARPTQRKAALEEIIDERIKLQAAKRLGIAVSEADVTGSILEIAKKNNKNEKEFAAMLAGMGVNIATMKERFRSGLAWRDVVRRQFGHQISIGMQDIERAVAAGASGPNAGTLTDLALVKILLPFPPKSDEKAKAARYADAEKLRKNFTNCRATPGLVQTVAGARLEDLGAREASTFPEPTRSVLLNAKVGEMTPPSIAAGGVELYAVCGREQRSVAESKRDEATRELQAQEFELLARKHLKSLRQDAVIDYR